MKSTLHLILLLGVSLFHCVFATRHDLLKIHSHDLRSPTGRSLTELEVPESCDELCNSMEYPTEIVSMVDAFLVSSCFFYGADRECCDGLERSGGTFANECECAESISCNLDPFDGRSVFSECGIELPECGSG